MLSQTFKAVLSHFLEAARLRMVRWGIGKVVAAKLNERVICITTETSASK